MAVAERKKYDLADILKDEKPFFCVLENIQDPGNAGTILRTADACGVSAVLCTKGTVDLYSDKVVRAAMGSLYHLPVLQQLDSAELIKSLKERGITTVASSPSAEKSFREISFAGASAVFIGNEGNGLSGETIEACDEVVTIPMPGHAESLNAAVAAALLIYRRVEDTL